MDKSIFSGLSVITFCSVILVACDPKSENSLPTNNNAESTRISHAAEGWDYSMAAEDLKNVCARVISDANMSLTNIANDKSKPTMNSVVEA